MLFKLLSMRHLWYEEPNRGLVQSLNRLQNLLDLVTPEINKEPMLNTIQDISSVNKVSMKTKSHEEILTIVQGIAIHPVLFALTLINAVEITPQSNPSCSTRKKKSKLGHVFQAKNKVSRICKITEVQKDLRNHWIFRGVQNICKGCRWMLQRIWALWINSLMALEAISTTHK